MMNSFKNVTINRSTKDEATFKQDCLNLFDSGFQFKFVMLNAIIDDLISGKANKLMPLYDAKTAIHNLLPFALNLCRFPNRKEYKIIKVSNSVLKILFSFHFLGAKGHRRPHFQ